MIWLMLHTMTYVIASPAVAHVGQESRLVSGVAAQLCGMNNYSDYRD